MTPLPAFACRGVTGWAMELDAIVKATKDQKKREAMNFSLCPYSTQRLGGLLMLPTVDSSLGPGHHVAFLRYQIKEVA